MIYCDIEGDERSFGLFFGCISRFFLVWYPPEFCFDPVLTHRHLIRHMPGAWCGTSGNCEAGLLAWRLDSVPAKPAPHFWKKQKLKHFSSLLFAFAHLGYLELQNTEDIFTADFWAASCYHVAMSRLAPVGAQVGRVAKTACLAAWLLEEFAEGEPSSGAISIEHGSRKGDSSSVAFSEFWNWFGICSASSNSFCHVYPVEGALRLAASCVFSCFFRVLSFLQTNPFVFDALHFPLDLNCQNPKDSAAKKSEIGSTYWYWGSCGKQTPKVPPCLHVKAARKASLLHPCDHRPWPMQAMAAGYRHISFHQKEPSECLHLQCHHQCMWEDAWDVHSSGCWGGIELLGFG